MRCPTTPPPFGQRLQTLGIPVLFAVAGQCTIRRFHGPDPVGNPVWPVLVGAWRPRGSYFGKTSVWPTMHSGSENNEVGSSS